MVYGRVVTATGWRWSEVDEMTLDQVDSLYAYWRSSPPVHELVAAYMGIKPEAEASEPAGISETEKYFVEKMRERMAARG